MKTKTLSMPQIITRGTMLLAAVVIGVTSIAMFAHAEVATPVTASARNASAATISTATIGSNVFINTVVASSSTTTIPTGTVNFYTYANNSCSGSPTVQSSVGLTGGSATSSAIVMSAAGLSYVVHYNGTQDFAQGDSLCQPVAATLVAPTLTGTLSTTTSIYAGSSITESSTLAGATANAGGSVAYNVYSNNSCTTLYQAAGTKTVTNALVPTSDSVTFNFAGTYYWRGVYSGDVNNGPATTSCAALVVLATTTTPVPPVVVGSSTISGIVYNDANKNDKLDAGEAGIAGFTINLYKNAGWWGKNGNNNPVVTVVTDANGNYSFSNLANGIYSVEEIKKAGWKQTSSDFKKLEIKNGVGLSGINFANVAQASTTVHGGHDKDDDGDDDHKGNKGKHWGWSRGHGFGWWKNN